MCSKQTQHKQAYPMVTSVSSVKVTSSHSVTEEKTGILRTTFSKKKKKKKKKKNHDQGNLRKQILST